MSEMFFVVAFAMLVLLPCAVAAVGLKLNAFGFGDLDGFVFFPPRALGSRPAPLAAFGIERPVTDEFVIRSFPKGLSAKRRPLIQDGVQVRVVAAVKKVVAVAVELADAVADMPAQVEVYPRTRRRGMMLAMLEAKNEADEWMARAALARVHLARTAAVSGTASVSFAEAAKTAATAATEAYRRVAKMEAMLQGRADAEMPTQRKPSEVRASLAA